MNSVYAMVVSDPNNFNLLTEDLKKRVLKGAVQTVNIQAAQTRKAALQNIQQQFNQRNDFTAKNIRFTSCPASVTSLQNVQSEVGATERANYMELQENGGIKTPRKGSLLNIPTTAAREGNTSAGKVESTKTVRGIKKRRLKGTYSRHYTSPKARGVARAYVAYNNDGVVHYDKNVFEVISFQKSGDSIHFDKKLIRNLNNEQAIIKPRPWLQPAQQKPAEQCQTIFNKAMEKIGV